MTRTRLSKKSSEISLEGSETQSTSGPHRSIFAVLVFALALLSVVGFFGMAGPLGEVLNQGFGGLFGWGKWVSPLLLGVAGVWLAGRRPDGWLEPVRFIGLFSVFAGLLGIFHWFFDPVEMLTQAQAGRGGGLLGFGLDWIFLQIAGRVGGSILLGVFFIIGVIASFDVSLIAWMDRISDYRTAHRLSDLSSKDAENIADESVYSKGYEHAHIRTREEEYVHERAEFETAYDETDGIAPWEDEQESEVGKLCLPGTPTANDAHLMKSNIGRIRFAGEVGMQSMSSESGVSQVPAAVEFGAPEEELTEIPLLVSRSMRRRTPKKVAWTLPKPGLVQGSDGVKTGGDQDSSANAVIIQKTLSHFGIGVEIGSIQVGPTVTQYTFRPAVGVKLSRITALNNDLALALAASSVRIEAPIPGKALVGVEVPNRSQSSVRFRELLESKAVMSRRNDSLLMILGKDVSDEVAVANLDKLPHLLIAGATNSGKSVCINTLLLSLLYRNTPEDLQIILIDPKRVELTPYNKIPHLKTDVIVEPKKVVGVLRWAVTEMERRYRVLEECQSRDITSYRAKRAAGESCMIVNPETGIKQPCPMETMPYIVIVIDEMADLMMAHGKDVESLIVRLAQMSRAVGIHLILATQRPSVEVITGLIKANIVARIAFQVATQIDSRTILDMGGAEKLLGRGDMLFLAPTAPQPRRMQGVFVSEEEVRAVTDFWREQAVAREDDGIPDSFDVDSESQSSSRRNGAVMVTNLPAPSDPFAAGGDFDLGGDVEQDERFEEAKQIVVESGKASASLLQRRMSVGYSRAARILDELEAAGIVGPADGAKPRTIYASSTVTPAPKQSITQPAYEDDLTDQDAREKWSM